MEKNKRKKVTQTSRLSHEQNKKNGTYKTQEQMVIELLKPEKTMNARQIVDTLVKQYAVKFPIGLRRAVSDLKRKGEIEIAFEDKCSISGRKVEFYRLPEKKEEEMTLFPYGLALC